MKIRNVLSTIILILVLSITVGFSAFVSEMSISNIVADVRLHEDVRITNVEFIGDDNYWVNSTELDYDKDSIMGNVTFNDENVAATYKITFTNFGNVDSYVELVENESRVNCEFSDGSEGVIEALGGTREITVLVFSPDYLAGNYDFKLNFGFFRTYNVSYEYLKNENEIAIEGKSFSTYIDEYGIEDIAIFMGGRQLDSSEYTYDYGAIAISDVSGDIIFRGPKTLNSVMRMNSVLDTNINFGSSDGLDTINNITYTRNGTQNDDYPIYYYRGNVTTNNVLFGDFCWKMVRTTETGGVKLIYNGLPAEDGSCNNSGTASQIGTSQFNKAYNSFAYHGYMYGDIYEVESRQMVDGEEIMYGVGVSYTDGTYTLTNTFSTSDWTNDKGTIGASYYYTCFNSSGTCSEVYYISHLSKISINYILLTSGDNLTSALVRMLKNQNSSVVKTKVDDWYLNNMTSHTNLLENEKWCSDRNAYFGGWSLNPSDRMLTDTYFGAQKRNEIDNSPTLKCSAPNNMLSINNGLTYPVALLTADELTFAGSGYNGYSNNSFLYTGEYWWTMSPWSFSSNMAYNGLLSNNADKAKLTYASTGTVSLGVRPAISLINNMRVASGDGTVSSPYQIKTKIILDLSYYGYGDVYYEPGMTWEEWVNSEYNNVGFVIDGDYIVDEYYTNYVVDSSYTRILASTIINSSETYSLRRYI